MHTSEIVTRARLPPFTDGDGAAFLHFSRRYRRSASHQPGSQVLTPKVVHRPRQRVPCLLSHFLTARKHMRPLVCSASGAVFPTRRHQRHSRMLQEVVSSTRDKHHEETGTFASAFLLHDRLLHLEEAVAKLSSDDRLLGHGV